METHTHRKYDSEFKRQAVHLSLEEGRTVSGVAEGLDIHNDLIYQWRKQLMKKRELFFPAQGFWFTVTGGFSMPAVISGDY